MLTRLPQRIRIVRPRDLQIPYNLGFTAASLRPELARIVAERYLAVGDWTVTKDELLTTNALQTRSRASAVRLEREFRQRLSRLSEPQLRILAEGTAEDRAAIAWLAALKHSGFIFEFASNVLRDKHETQDMIVRYSDYERFFSESLPAHPELGGLADSSALRIRQALFRMLAEAGLLEKGEALGTIRRPVLSPSVIEAVTSDEPAWLAGFLVPDNDIDQL